VRAKDLNISQRRESIETYSHAQMEVTA